MENLFILLYYATMGLFGFGLIFSILYLLDPNFRDDFHDDWSK